MVVVLSSWIHLMYVLLEHWTQPQINYVSGGHGGRDEGLVMAGCFLEQDKCGCGKGWWVGCKGSGCTVVEAFFGFHSISTEVAGLWI